MDEKRVADYFIISGVPEQPEHRVESKPLINSALPITDVTVIIKGSGEVCPIGYTCIEYTPHGHVADLNNGNFKSPNIHICYRRGNDKPPLVDIGVYHQDKDQVLPGVEIVQRTPYGRCASTGNSAQKYGTYITFRRAKTINPFNQLVVVDLCVILNNKSEHPPHAYYSIKKNLNKSYYGMIGSEVFLCYRKTLLSPPSLGFTPQIVSRFPLQDCATFPLPDTVPLFCLPAGASIELRPANVPLPRPVTTTFVLTSDSAQKIYGSALSFYEPFDASLLTLEQRERLGIVEKDTNLETPDHNINYQKTFALKSICILSKWPFFECFEKYLNFLHKLVFSPLYSPVNPDSPTHRNNLPLEHHISHFLLDVAFPTPQRPTVMVQLIPGTDETLTISQPSSRLPLPLTGASFIQLLSTLGVENTMNVLLFGLCEQKILLHSLHPSNLTGVAEAITAMLFPFHWQCPYVPLCPLSLHGILNAPLPFIVGIDSRCFDTFTPPDDVICIDLDTKSIILSEHKKCLNLRILPKRAARVLRGSLDKIFQHWIRISQAIGANQSPQHRTPQMEASRRQLAKKLELEIQEAFVRFMATILRGFRSYLLPITRAPTVGATDPTSLFNFEGFLMSRDRSYSQFYQLITKTQMFTHYIEERSFVSDKDTSLAFFDDCEERLAASDDLFPGKPIKLFDKDDGIIQTDRSVYIPAPEQSPSVSHSNSMNDSQQEQQVDSERKLKFGPLNTALFHRHPQRNKFPSLDTAPTSTSFENHMLFENVSNEPNAPFSISRRTKQEVKASQRMAKKSADNPLDWSKYLVSCCYCLWFSTLPSYIAYCKSVNHEEEGANDDASIEKSTARILRYAHSTIARMQKLEMTTDEVCFRILTLLCGHYGQPALAVRVFFEMKKAGIKPNAVTYGYYNKAVLESRWPDHSIRPTMVLWTKIRNVISGIALFKSHGRLRMERRQKLSINMISGDMSFGHINIVDQTRASANNEAETSLSLTQPATSPSAKEENQDVKLYKGLSKHRRSLFNRSYSTYQKCTEEQPGDSNDFNLMDLRDEHKSTMHKSYSMHLRDGSPERGSLLCIRTSSADDEDEPPIVAQKLLNNHNQMIPNRRIASTDDVFLALKERNQLLAELDDDNVLIDNVDLIDNQAGLLFTSDPETCRNVNRPASQSPVLLGDLVHSNSAAPNNSQPDTLFPTLPVNNQTSGESELLNASCFGEDAQILRKIENCEQKPNFADSVDFLHQPDDVSSEDAHSNKLSESITDPSTGNPSNEDNFSLNNISSTPNFKIASLINDASNLQWSKWTSSQNSKSVYKGIKSAATGIVSSLQEIKSSFSISNSATPAKMITTAQHKSSTTREMLSQWATQFGYFSSQTHRGGYDDSDSDSVTSNDLFRLSNDEDVEQSSAEANDFRLCQGLFSSLEKHYHNSSSREDLVNHSLEEDEVEGDRVAIVINITTCSRCNVCHSLLYDEEIMERWSHNESNLNTRCIYCRAKIVPLMSIQVEDRRFSASSFQEESTSKVTSSSDVTDDLVNLDLDSEKNGVEDHSASPKTCLETDAIEAESGEVRPLTGWCRKDFTVPYLSPIVLRKELESVFESSGDNCPSSSRFIDEHPIIFWNLLWYFTRINVPTHLALLCLSSKSILAGKEVPERSKSLDKVVVKTLWDNEKLHTGIGRPLYRLLERGEPSPMVQSILCDDIHFTKNFLDQVINLIKSNELQKAMNLVLNARLKESTKFSFDRNRHNLYRDLIFLINITFGPGKLYMDNFEREYKRAFENLNFQQVALNRFDRPPTTRSLFCRKCFKEPSLTKRSF